MVEHDQIYIRVKGQDFGPFDSESTQRKVASGDVPFSAWVFSNQGWKLLAEDAALREKHPEFEKKPDTPPTEKASSKKISALKEAALSATVSADPIWFAVRDKKKYGPYSAAEIVAQLQAKKIDARSFVWRPGFETWKVLSQVPEFSKQAMRKLADDRASADVLIKRKYPRAPYEVEVIAHDHTKVFEGKTMVIGEGGLFLATAKPVHLVGSRLKLHFREGAASSFNAIAEVVSVQRGENPGYAMRFVALSDSDRRRINKYVSETKK